MRSAAGARLSVVVGDPWRAAALAAEFAGRRVGGEAPVPTTTGGLAVRTPFTPELDPLAGDWTRGARQRVPAGFQLTAGGLRLWTIATGRPDESGFILVGVPADDPLHLLAGAQLARLGLAAAAVLRLPGAGTPRAGWRITSARRLRRFTELVGPPPASLGQEDRAAWPSA